MTINKKQCFGLVGWNGMKNVGDDAMTSVIINYIRKYNSNASFKLLADTNSLASYTPGTANGISGYRGYNKIHLLPYVRRFARRFLFLEDFTEKADVILIGGGSIFHNVHSTYWHRETTIMKKKRNPGAIVGAISVSLGPFKRPEEIAKCEKALNALDFITLRDEKSFLITKKMNISTPVLRTMDVAILLPDLLNLNTKTSGGSQKQHHTIGIALRSGMVSRRSLNYISRCLNAIMAKDNTVRLFLFVFCRDNMLGDYSITNKLRTSIVYRERVQLVDYSLNPIEFYRKISTCDLMIAERLHASVISYAVGTPFLMLSYAEKCKSFAQEVGLDEKHIFDVNSIDRSSFSNCLEKWLQSDYKLSSSWSLPLQDAKKLAQNNFYFLKSVLQEGKSLI